MMPIAPEEPCQFCGHPYSMHFSDDVHGVGSKDPSMVHAGCSYRSDGIPCPCPGFRSHSRVLGEK